MGFIYNRVNFQLTTAICMMYSAIFTLIIPHIRVAWLLLTIFVIDQIGLGAYEAGSNMFILHLWGKEATPFMQCLQSMFGFGALIAPVVLVPFLVETDDENGVSNSNGKNETSGEVFHPEDIQLVYPYTIVSAYLIINSIYMLTCYCMYPETTPHPSRAREESSHENSIRTPESDQQSVINRSESSDHKGQDDEEPLMPVLDCCNSITTESEQQQPPVEDPSHRFWRIVTVCITLLFMHIYLGLEITFGSYLTAFAVKCKLHLSKAYGAFLTTVYWTSFTLFRLLTILYIDYTGIGVNIAGSIVMVLISNAFLLPHGDESLAMLWTGIILIGIGTSSIFACMFGFLEQYFEVTSMISALMIMSAVLGEFTFPAVISRFIESTPAIFLWVTLFCSIGIAILFAIIALICRFKLRKVATEK